MDKCGNKMCLGWNEYSRKVFDVVWTFRMDEYQLHTKINTLLLHRSNRTDEHAPVGTHGDPTRVRG